MTKIKLNGKTYNIELTLQNLKDFGFVPNKVDENTAKLAEIIASLKVGDTFTLVDVLSKLLAKDGLDEDQVAEEASKDKNFDKLFDTMIDFFNEAPFTKRMMKTINPALDGALDKMNQAIEEAE